MSKRWRTVSIKVPEELYKEVKKFADENYTKLSDAIRRLIVDSLRARRAEKDNIERFGD